MPIFGEIKGTQVSANLWTDIEGVDSGALTQIRNVASLAPTVAVSIMPDVHLGVGACIGSVIAMQDAVAPSLTGVDIGCGMTAIKTHLKRADLSQGQLQATYKQILRSVPVGFNWHKDAKGRSIYEEYADSMDKYDQEIPKAIRAAEDKSKVECQIGTLGGGNHFIEVSYDADDCIWLLLHSGSRNVGYKIADYYIKLAKKQMPNGLPDKDLAYFTKGDGLFEEYWQSMQWAQRYARNNRSVMMAMVFRAVNDQKFSGNDQIISCHHNFAEAEKHEEISDSPVIVIRKGAIEAAEGQLGIIPGAMGRDSYIVRGLGNSLALRSAPHGAGRIMSRTQAKKKFTSEELEDTLAGIIARNDNGVLDEICYSYKDINDVMNRSSDLVEPVAKLRQLICIKG
jgi:tRNA-splicing ligase RtcB